MSNGRLLTIAIDGPAAAGKSTASKALAKRLNLTLVDTGALYRSVALAAKRKGVPWDETQESELGSIAKSLDVRFEFDGAEPSAKLAPDVPTHARVILLSIASFETTHHS